MANQLLKSELKVINMGLRSFADNLKTESVKAVHMNWSPPASGKPHLMDLLRRYYQLDDSK